MQYISLTKQGQINLRAKHPALPGAPATRQFQARFASMIAKPGRIIHKSQDSFTLAFKGVSGEYIVPITDTISATFVDIRPDIGKQLSFKDVKRNTIAAIPQTAEGTKVSLLAESATDLDSLARILAGEATVPSVIWRFMLQSCISPV